MAVSGCVRLWVAVSGCGLLWGLCEAASDFGWLWIVECEWVVSVPSSVLESGVLSRFNRVCWLFIDTDAYRIHV